MEKNTSIRNEPMKTPGSCVATLVRIGIIALRSTCLNRMVRTARAKGVPENTILFKHVLRNAMIPILTNVATQLPGVFIGSFLIEVFFSIPGLGREVYTAVGRSDYPMIQATTIYLAALTMVINLFTDVLYKFVDPRVVLK